MLEALEAQREQTAATHLSFESAWREAQVVFGGRASEVSFHLSGSLLDVLLKLVL